MKTLLALAVLAAALPASALDWSNGDLVTQFKTGLNMTAVAESKPIKAVAVGNPFTARRDWKRWRTVIAEAGTGTPVDGADLAWAEKNFSRMTRKTLRKAHLRRQVRREVREAAAALPKAARPSFKERREAVSQVTKIGELKLVLAVAILLKAAKTK